MTKPALIAFILLLVSLPPRSLAGEGKAETPLHAQNDSHGESLPMEVYDNLIFFTPLNSAYTIWLTPFRSAVRK